MKRAEIVAEARRYVELKTPWRKNGRSERGLDCGGLIAVVGDKFGLPRGEYHGDILNPDGKQLVRLFKESMVVTHPPLKPGMVVMLQNFGMPWHLGIIGDLHGHLSMIHIAANRRYTSEETFSRDTEKCLCMCFDFPGVED